METVLPNKSTVTQNYHIHSLEGHRNIVGVFGGVVKGGSCRIENMDHFVDLWVFVVLVYAVRTEFV